MARLKPYPVTQLNEKQRELLMQNPRLAQRTEVNGPTLAMMLSPDFAQAAFPFGQFVQYKTPFASKLRELVILVIARAWSCEFVWFAHARDAIREGISAQNVEAIRTHQKPNFELEDERLFYEITVALQTDKKIPDALYERAVEQIGQDGLFQLIGLVGYYTFVSMVANGFELEAPTGNPKQLTN